MAAVDNPRTRGQDISSTGSTVASNIARVRRASDVSLQQLEERLTRLGRRISFSGLSKIERAQKRVEVDDLMAIAIALDVSPLTLLLPHDDPYAEVRVTGAAGSAAVFWEWALGDRPLDPQDRRGYAARALPAWLGSTADVVWWGDQSMTLAIGDEAPRKIAEVQYRARDRSEVDWPGH